MPPKVDEVQATHGSQKAFRSEASSRSTSRDERKAALMRLSEGRRGRRALSVGTGGFEFDLSCDILLLRQNKNIELATERTASVIPTPMPAFAPVLSPEEFADVVDILWDRFIVRDGRQSVAVSQILRYLNVEGDPRHHLCISAIRRTELLEAI